ncbi:MAG: CopG family transcriptional regulator [Planctomycetota bacterium]
MTESEVSITIPAPLYEHIQGLIAGSGFKSVRDYILFILRDIACEGRADPPENPTPYEIRRIKDKLKLLGYL